MIRKLLKKIRGKADTKDGAAPASGETPKPAPETPKPRARRAPARRPSLPADVGTAKAEWKPARTRKTEPSPEEGSSRPPRGSRSPAERGSDAAPADSADATRRRRRRRGGRGRRSANGERRTGEHEAPREASADGRRQPASPTQAPAPEAAAVSAWDPATFDVPPKEGATRFHDLDLPPEIMRAVADLGFAYCTPVQAESLPILLAGRDIAGRAQTGTGKTAAFLIAIFNRCLRHPVRGDRPAATPRALVIAPTRELAVQIEKDAKALGAHAGVHALALFGGADFDGQLRKVKALNPELIVATPGRLLDFRSRHELNLGRVEVMVIDEADRMLDMGFIPDVRRIIYATPPKTKRQTMLFSATLSEPVMRLASSWMVDAARVDIEPEQVAVDSVRQMFYLVTSREKFTLLYHILREENPERVLMFVNRRITAERLTRALKQHGFTCALISGALAQNQRSRTLEAFREGTVPILVATDVAGRGLHIEGVSHVINYNIPLDAEDYVHRIGRTGRAGATGTSITFACEEESFYIPAIEAYVGQNLACEHPPEAWLTMPDDVPWVEIPDEEEPERGRRTDRRRSGGRSGGGPPGRGRPRR